MTWAPAVPRSWAEEPGRPATNMNDLRDKLDHLASLVGVHSSEGLALKLLRNAILEGEKVAYSLELLSRTMGDTDCGRWVATAAEDAELLEGDY